MSVSGYGDPDISVIVPAFNASQTIVECLESIFKAKGISVEVIVIDDGSIDGTSQIVSNISVPENHALAVVKTANQGVASARNVGLANARGKIVAFVDSDDTIRPDNFVNLYNKFSKSDCDIAVGGVCIHFVDGHTEYRRVPSELQNRVMYGEGAFRTLQGTGTFTPLVFAYLWKRDFIDRNGLRFQYRMSEDDLWTTKAICLARNVLFTDCIHYDYVKREQSLTAVNQVGKLRIDCHYSVASELFKFISCRDFSVETNGWIACKILYLICDVLATDKRLSQTEPGLLVMCRELKSHISRSANMQIRRIGATYLLRIQNLVRQA